MRARERDTHSERDARNFDWFRLSSTGTGARIKSTVGSGALSPRERERRLLLSWAKAGKYSKESREATRSEGDDL